MTGPVRLLTAVGCAVMALLATCCGPTASAQAAPTLALYDFTHPAMGTDYALHLYSSSQARAEVIAGEVFDEIDRIDQLLSNYKPSSELSRINREADQAPVTTDPEMLDFLEQSLHWSQVSDGAFDITVGKLMKAWGFYQHQGRIAPQAELDRLRAATGWTRILLDPHDHTVRFTSPGVELDPGGIGKGFAVDAAVRILRDDQVSAALISAGGSTIYALGAPPGTAGWPIVLPGPLPSTATLTTITLRDTSLSSADCSQKHFVANQHLYCHIMDPRTMRPVEGRIQVSIVSPSATASDALSNVLFVQPPGQSLATLKAWAADARAVIVSGDAKHPTCVSYRWPQPIDATSCSSEKSVP